MAKTFADPTAYNERTNPEVQDRLQVANSSNGATEFMKLSGLLKKAKEENNEPEALAIAELRLHDPSLNFAGFADTSTATPAHVSGNAYKVTEAGTVFGIPAAQGQIIQDDGVNFTAISIKTPRDYFGTGALVSYIASDTSLLYMILRRVEGFAMTIPEDWSIAKNSFYITKIGLTDNSQPYSNPGNLPEIIMSCGGGQDFKALRFSGATSTHNGTSIIMDGTPVDSEAEGMNGRITLSKADWDALKTNSYDAGVGVYESPYKISYANFFKKIGIDTEQVNHLENKITIPISEDKIAPDELFNGILSRINFPEIVFTKNFGFEKWVDVLFIRHMGLLDPSLPYDFSTNDPRITIAWYDSSTNTIHDVAYIRKSSYVYSDSVRLLDLYGVKKSNAIIHPLNDSGISGSAISSIEDLWDALKVNTYEINDFANIKFIIPTSSVKFEYESELVTSNVSGIYNIPPVNKDMHKKFPNLYKHLLKRDVNINVIVVGDSISARDYHTSYFDAETQTKRPPLMVSKNIGSSIYDKLTWQNAEYARFDRTSSFTEDGAFVTVDSSNLPSQGITSGTGITGDEWYDIADRPADTRIYTGIYAASAQFTIPAETYIANWIYRTDLKGCQNVTVSITEGAGLVEVYDKATLAWVEANGYIFSMRHPGVSTHRINTKFQERLRFRCADKHKGGVFDSRTTAKTVKIQKDTTDSRFLYWGIEWSKEPYIVSVINASRGGKSIASMLPALDDDVFDWVHDSPDSFSFIVHEIYLNQGANSYGADKSIAEFLSEWNDYFYSDINTYSFREQSKEGTIPWQKYEALSWNANPTVYGGGILTAEPYGWKTWENPTDGMKTILDNFLSYAQNYIESYDEVGNTFVNVTSALIEEAKMKYGEQWYQAFESSSVTGETFYNDVTHPNDYGVQVIMRWLNSNFDFLLM